MGIDKVIVNTLNTAERLNGLKDRKAKVEAAVDYFRQGQVCTRTLLVSGVIGPAGARVFQHINSAIGELELEVTMLHRTIVRLEEQQAAEELVVPQTKKGGRRVPKH